jgi:hypothetical protein
MLRRDPYHGIIADDPRLLENLGRIPEGPPKELSDPYTRIGITPDELRTTTPGQHLMRMGNRMDRLQRARNQEGRMRELLADIDKDMLLTSADRKALTRTAAAAERSKRQVPYYGVPKRIKGVLTGAELRDTMEALAQEGYTIPRGLSFDEMVFRGF